ncbi:MAG: GNAT family N-acetyltransferase [Pseudomonadota bacterium]
MPTNNDLAKLYAKEKEWNWINYGTLLLFSFNLRKEIPYVKDNTSAEIKFITDKSFDTKGILINTYNKHSNIFEDRLRKGDICCAAFFRNEIVSYCWVALREAYIGEIGKKIRLKNNELYLYDAFTKPGLRGNNLFPKILEAILSYGREKGCQTILTFVLSSNNSSVKAIKKVGFGRFQSVYFVDVCNKILCRFSKVKDVELTIEGRLVPTNDL